MTPQVEQTSASDVQSEQGDVKEEGIDLLHARRLKGRLPLWRARSVEGFRRLVKRRNNLMLDPAAQGLAGLQVTQILRGNVDDVVEGGG